MFVSTVSWICSSVIVKNLPQAALPAFHNPNRTPETPASEGHLASMAAKTDVIDAVLYAARGNDAAWYGGALSVEDRGEEQDDVRCLRLR
jgi:hypothetical protein